MFFKKIIWWIWCLPQMLIGVFLLIYCKLRGYIDHTENVKGRKYWYINWNSGSISLGRWIFLCPCHWDDEETKKHEFGHTIQSLILGPLYLLVIGLPSIIWCDFFEWYWIRPEIGYYKFYTEAWANKLAHVEIY